MFKEPFIADVLLYQVISNRATLTQHAGHLGISEQLSDVNVPVDDPVALQLPSSMHFYFLWSGTLV
jgi:hypothetical protein